MVYDLGCGDGRIVVTAARRYGCRAVGYDLDLLRVEEARKNVAKHRVGHLVTIDQQDVLHSDLQGASVVTLYLGTEINARLIPQLEKLPPGARIVSHDFPLGDLTPDKVVEMTSREDGRRHTHLSLDLPTDNETEVSAHKVRPRQALSGRSYVLARLLEASGDGSPKRDPSCLGTHARPTEEIRRGRNSRSDLYLVNPLGGVTPSQVWPAALTRTIVVL